MDMPDPSTLTDEELDRILAGEDQEDTQDENPDTQDDADTDVENLEDADEDADDTEEEDEDKSDEDTEDKTDSKKPADKKDDKDDSKPPSRREQLRVAQLLKKYGEPGESKTKPEVKDALDYDSELNADDDTKEKLKADREKVASDSFNQGLEQAKSIEFRTLLEIDAPRVEAKYPQLDKNSSEFKEDAATDVNLLYLQLAGFDPQTGKVENPGFRYAPFVDTIFALVQDLAAEKAQEITKTVKKQAAKTGLRPDGSRTKKLNLNKAPEDMSDEELDAYLAQAIPS